ncbi:MAG: hypothetical protein ACRD1G_16465, partial [Acidimicrobiales bacterium]
MLFPEVGVRSDVAQGINRLRDAPIAVIKHRRDMSQRIASCLQESAGRVAVTGCLIQGVGHADLMAVGIIGVRRRVVALIRVSRQRVEVGLVLRDLRIAVGQGGLRD